jgi:hypothetical protein
VRRRVRALVGNRRLKGRRRQPVHKTRPDAPRIPRSIRPPVPVSTPPWLSSGVSLVQTVARVVAGKPSPRTAGAGRPARCLVTARGAAQEHPTAFNLKERIVAAEAADGTRPRPRGPGPPGPNDAEWVRGANNLRGRVCDIRRHILRRSLAPSNYDAGPDRHVSSNPPGRHSSPFKRSAISGINR